MIGRSIDRVYSDDSRAMSSLPARLGRTTDPRLSLASHKDCQQCCKVATLKDTINFVY